MSSEHTYYLSHRDGVFGARAEDSSLADALRALWREQALARHAREGAADGEEAGGGEEAGDDPHEAPGGAAGAEVPLDAAGRARAKSLRGLPVDGVSVYRYDDGALQLRCTLRGVCEPIGDEAWLRRIAALLEAPPPPPAAAPPER